MTSFQRRVSVTIACAATFLGLWFLPASDSGLVVAELGLAPYLIATTLAGLAAIVTRGAFPSMERAEAWILGAATLIALAWSAARIALDHSMEIPTSSFAVVLLLAGSLGPIALAHTISLHGVGNGLCVLVGAAGALRLFGILRDALEAGRQAVGPEFLPVLLFGLGWITLAIAWTRVRWTPDSPAEVPGDTGAWTLPVAGVGTVAIGLVHATFQSAGWITAPFDPESAVTPRFLLLGMPVAFAALSILGGVLWTGLVFDAEGLPARLRARLPKAEFDHLVWHHTRGFLIGAPLAATFVVYGSAALGFDSVFALIVFPLVAIVWDTAEQVAVHRRLMPPAVDDAATCSSCGGSVGDDEAWCPGCGALYEDGEPCVAHADRPAIVRCILCAQALCRSCERRRDGRSLCPQHRRHELVDGWAVVARVGTRAEGHDRVQELRGRGFDAVVLSSTPGPLSGSTGLFDLRDLVPFAAHPRSAGSGIRILVPARSALAALADPEPGSMTA